MSRSYWRAVQYFCYGTFRRGWFGLALLTFVLFPRVFQSHIFQQPWMPRYLFARADDLMSLGEVGALIIAIAFLLWGAFSTYHDAFRQIRDPKVSQSLATFYGELEMLVGTTVRTEQDLVDFNNRTNAKIDEIVDWVKRNMSRASYIRLQQQNPTGILNFGVINDPDSLQGRHRRSLDRLLKFQDRVALLIEKTAWL